MTNGLMFHERTRAQLREAAAQTLVILPVGATEQHGPHLPVGTDWLAVQHIAQGAAEQAATQIPILVAPVMPFGCSQHHLPFGGTFSLTTETYYRVIYELAESLVTDGFRRLFILNGHGGNNELVQLVARDIALKHPVDAAAASYWTIAWDGLVEAGGHLQGNLPGHAGAFETSLVLALQPELVAEPRPGRDAFTPANPPRVVPPYRSELTGKWQEIDGYSDSPARGQAERGREYFALIISAVSKAFVEFYQASAKNIPPEGKA